MIIKIYQYFCISIYNLTGYFAHNNFPGTTYGIIEVDSDLGARLLMAQDFQYSQNVMIVTLRKIILLTLEILLILSINGWHDDYVNNPYSRKPA